MRILVTGSRSWDDYNTVARGLTVALETLIKKFPDDKEITLVHGNAKGADTLADNFMYRSRKFLASKGYRLVIEPHPADWERYGKGAGVIRNKEMVDAGADMIVAFIRNASPGATNCLKLATAAGIESLVYKA